MTEIALFWFRRDLRLSDNAGLYHALRGDYPVLPLFIFDREILDRLEDKDDARVHFLHETVRELKTALEEQGSSLIVAYGHPEKIWAKLLKKYKVKAVYTNHDYEPYALQRDTALAQTLEKKGIPLKTFKDHVIFEKGEVLKKDGTPYTVFTPYSRIWYDKLDSKMVKEGRKSISYYLQAYPTEKYFSQFHKTQITDFPTLKSMGFEPSSIPFPKKTVAQGIIRKYGEQRNFPAIKGTSRLGLHFRFGTLSVREKARKALALSRTYVNELVWRDFYSMILHHFPHVVNAPFRAKYAGIEWNNNMEEFELWCQGQTGYPIVDAGMRELNATGFMHNRVRMIVASFLTKHLLIDWRLGAAYFARKLLDFDLASNNGGWQWAAGCGTDAAPYFRIFNPYSQQEKFDKQFKYIKKWVPEYGTPDYAEPIVDHKFARERCLRIYKEGLAKAEMVGEK